MTKLSKDLLNFLIFKLENDINHLKGFISLGNEIERHAKYTKWLEELKAYQFENYPLEKEQSKSISDPVALKLIEHLERIEQRHDKY